MIGLIILACNWSDFFSDDACDTEKNISSFVDAQISVKNKGELILCISFFNILMLFMIFPTSVG